MCKRIRCSKCVPKKIFSKEEAFSVSPAIVKIHGCKEFWKQNREVECSMVLGRGAKFINIATICHLKGSYSFFCLSAFLSLFFLFFCVFIFFFVFLHFYLFFVFLHFYLFFGFSAFLFHCFEINFKKFQVSKCIQWASIDVRCTRWEKSEVIGLFFYIKNVARATQITLQGMLLQNQGWGKSFRRSSISIYLVKSECERSPPDIFVNKKSC